MRLSRKPFDERRSLPLTLLGRTIEFPSPTKTTLTYLTTRPLVCNSGLLVHSSELIQQPTHESRLTGIDMAFTHTIPIRISPSQKKADLPITTKLTDFLSPVPSSCFFASSRTFSLATLILGGGSSTGGLYSSSRFNAAISNCLESVLRTGVEVPDFFAPVPFLEVAVSFVVASAAFFCWASFNAFSCFSFSLAATLY